MKVIGVVGQFFHGWIGESVGLKGFAGAEPVFGMRGEEIRGVTGEALARRVPQDAANVTSKTKRPWVLAQGSLPSELCRFPL